MEKKTFAGIFAVSATITALLISLHESTDASSFERAINANIAAIETNLENELNDGTKLALSSSPYDYTEAYKEYDNIVSLGNDALPYIEEIIDASPGSGLVDYMLSLAVEEIAKVDLKKSNFQWSTGDSFSRTWKSHLKEIPAKTKQIAESNNPEAAKNEELKELGTPAIPFILDEIENGHEELLPAAVDLIGDKPETLTSPAEVQDWVGKERLKFIKLKQYVEKK
ncbi:hypothetical protein PALU110988_20045 [Paenibacillus lupini]|uniref:hypothetical protein n=1 Tax=Paenibacillus lupini TaxID=1450204 RepID=UPI00141EB98B|nr:hypothetical protein [Paenibacillus lupini]NIK21909.1 hypothetical protein [Paenibacillus lupini]